MLLISVSAQASSERTGVLDVQAVFNRSALGKKDQGIMRGYYESRKKILDEDADEIQNLREDYGKQMQAKALNEPAQKAKEETLKRKINEFEKKRAEFAEEVSRKTEELQNDFLKQVQIVLQDVAKREKISLILNKTISLAKTDVPSVMYADNELDVTDKVIVEMDKTAPAVN